MEWAEALNNAIEQTLPPRDEMIPAIIKMLFEAPYATKKAIALYIYDAGYQFQDSARGCIINSKKLSDTTIAHIYTTLIDSTKPMINIGDISLE
jgi:hypothetical protein